MGLSSARKNNNLSCYNLADSFNFSALHSRLSPLLPPGSEEMAAPCQESAVRLLAHTGQARGLCPGLAGAMLLQVSHHLKKSQERREGQQIKCLQGKYPLDTMFST